MPNNPAQQAKPGTACLGCRSRKLKCSRDENGCTNCVKSELPCVYPTPEIGVKRKRGPYKKDKPPRERHLEDLVRYLEPKSGNPFQSRESNDSPKADQRPASTPFRSFPPASSPPQSDAAATELALISRFRQGDGAQGSSSEALVKDALIALTKSSVSEREAHAEQNRAGAPPGASGSHQPSGVLGVHPPSRIIFEYFHLYTIRGDHLLKLIHLPTVSKRLFANIDNLQEADLNFQTLLFGIYYCAVCTCTAPEIREKFGESRMALLRRYGRTIEANLSDNYSMPTVEALQGLLLYLKSVQRAEVDTSVRALFSLAVRMAQLIGLQDDPGDSFSPFEAEMRRRAWWHVCGLESRGAEEGESRVTTIMDGRNVRFPGNYNDCDLRLDMTIWPEPRVGATEMTYVLVRLEMVYLSYLMWTARRQARKLPGLDAKVEQTRHLEEGRQRIESIYTQYLNTSRDFDWMTLEFIDIVMTKYHLMIEYPSVGVPTPQMSKEQRMDLLQSSVKVIRITHSLATHDRFGNWRWFARSWIQWHSLAIVIAELARSTNNEFNSNAWDVLDPILAEWDHMYLAKKGEPAWEHVNTIVERAKRMRHQPNPASRECSNLSSQTMQHAASDQAAQHQQTSVVPPVSWATPQDPIPNFMPPSSGQFEPSMASNVFSTPMINVGDDMSQWNEPLVDIDFSAFDAVFGDTAWTFPHANAVFPVYEMGDIPI